MSFILTPIKVVQKKLSRDSEDEFKSLIKKIADKSIRSIRSGKNNIFKYDETDGKVYILVRHGKKPIYGLLHENITSLPFAINIANGYFTDLSNGRVEVSHLELIKKEFDECKSQHNPRSKKIRFLED